MSKNKGMGAEIRDVEINNFPIPSLILSWIIFQKLGVIPM
jgi:hypothetical protein